MNWNEYKSKIIDTNSNSETTVFDIEDFTRGNVIVQAETGSHNNHEVTVFFKPKGGDWMPSGHKITGEGYLIFDVMFNKMKVTVTTAEGAPSTSKIIMVGTRA